MFICLNNILIINKFSRVTAYRLTDKTTLYLSIKLILKVKYVITIIMMAKTCTYKIHSESFDNYALVWTRKMLTCIPSLCCYDYNDKKLISPFLNTMWYAALLRFIRRRLVLGIIFASSLTYCIVSFLREVSIITSRFALFEKQIFIQCKTYKSIHCNHLF